MTIAQKGQVLAGKYRIERILGSGGMGEVLAARHVDLQRDVALKFLHPSLMTRTDLVERFLREARALAQLQSEHAVRVMDVAKLEDGSPYMVMELLRGSDLHSVLDAGPLPLDEAIEYVLQAAEALAEAHGLGIVHRDLKPSNLFLAQRPDGSHLVKVLDFGISKIAVEEAGPDASVTATNSFLGSPRYMSPEQIRSAKNVDRRADIWSLGVVLYELTTGKHPFEAETVAEVIGLVLHQSPAPPSAHRPEIPAELDAVIARCLEKDRELRFPDLGAFAEALGALGPPRARLSMERVVRMASLPPAAPEPLETSREATETHPSPVDPSAPAPAPEAAAVAGGSERPRPPAADALAAESAPSSGAAAAASPAFAPPSTVLPERSPEERTLTASAWGGSATPPRPRTRRNLLALAAALLVALSAVVIGKLTSRPSVSEGPASPSGRASVFGSLEPSASSAAPEPIIPPVVSPAPESRANAPALAEPGVELAPSPLPAPERTATSREEAAVSARSEAATSAPRRPKKAARGTTKRAPETPSAQQGKPTSRAAPAAKKAPKPEWEQEWLEKRVIGK